MLVGSPKLGNQAFGQFHSDLFPAGFARQQTPLPLKAGSKSFQTSAVKRIHDSAIHAAMQAVAAGSLCLVSHNRNFSIWRTAMNDTYAVIWI